MKVLIIRGGALGDTLMLLPALSVLSTPEEILFAGREPGLALMKAHVTAAMDLERAGWHRLFQGCEPEGPLPVAHADRVIAFFRDRSGILHRRLERFFPSARIHTCPSFPLTHSAIHVAQYVAQCLQGAGLSVDPHQALKNALQRNLIQNTPCREKSGWVVFHPGSGDLNKNHPPEWWGPLMDRFAQYSKHRGTAHVLLLGPAEQKLGSQFQDWLKASPLKIIRSPSVENLTRLLKAARLFIGHDSGITHLAAMLGVPTIALFKTSNPVQWRPLGPRVQVMTRTSADPGLARAVCAAAAVWLKRNPADPDGSAVHLSHKNRPVKPDISYFFRKPEQVPTEVLAEIREMVRRGHGVGISLMEANLKNAFLIGYAMCEGAVVGTSTHKVPQEAYCQKIEAATGLDLSGFLERGYTAVAADFQGMGIGGALIRGLIQRSQGRRIYVTIRLNNTPALRMTYREHMQLAATFVNGRTGHELGVFTNTPREGNEGDQ